MKSPFNGRDPLQIWRNHSAAQAKMGGMLNSECERLRDKEKRLQRCLTYQAGMS